MRPLIIFFVLPFFFFQTVYAQGLIYADSLAHFSVSLPDGWKQIQKSVMEQSLAVTRERVSAEVPNYSAGFQLSDRKDFQYPYILIEVRKRNVPSYEEIEKTLSNGFEGKTEKIAGNYSELLNGTNFEKPFLDKDRNAVFSTIEGDVTGIGKMKGLVVMFLGKEGFTQFGFYSTADEYEQFLPVFKSIIDSFKYDTGFQYGSTTAQGDSAWTGVIEKGIAGGISGFFIAILVFAFSFFSKKGSKKNTTQATQEKILPITNNSNPGYSPIKSLKITVEKINKISLPVVVLVVSVILGGSYYATETNKQKSIERQQQITFEQDRQMLLSQEQKILEDRERSKQDLNDCISDAETQAKKWGNRVLELHNECKVKGGGVCRTAQAFIEELDKNDAELQQNKADCFRRYPQK